MGEHKLKIERTEAEEQERSTKQREEDNWSSEEKLKRQAEDREDRDAKAHFATAEQEMGRRHAQALKDKKSQQENELVAAKQEHEQNRKNAMGQKQRAIVFDGAGLHNAAVR